MTQYRYSDRGDLLELHFDAYIHTSEGTPGVDAGTGWTQDVILVFDSGTLEGSITEWPADLYDGKLEIDGEPVRTPFRFP